jgi:ribonuclease P protein component
MAGGTVARTAHFVLHRLSLTDQATPLTGPESSRPQALFAVQDVWMGALVPKRWAKRAVTRNTIKRQIYNVSATFELNMAQAAHVVRLRATFDRKVFLSATSDVLKQAVRVELEQLFNRAAS